MFEVGEYVVYGNSGVCKVEKIGTLDVGGVSKDKLYYTLTPLYLTGSKVFTPIDNEKVIMRPIISKENAMELIDDIVNVETLWIIDEKKREEVYKEAVKKCDCRELVSIIKTVYLRKQVRLAEGKKITSSDEKYFKMAEDYLFGELALPLKMDKDKIEDFIIQRIEQMDMA